MNTILTDDERRAAWDSAPRLHQDDIARAIEAAVLAKLREQEPVAWHTEDHLDDRSATTYSKEAAQRWRDKGWPVTPLYAAPLPAVVQVPQGRRTAFGMTHVEYLNEVVKWLDSRRERLHHEGCSVHEPSARCNCGLHKALTNIRAVVNELAAAPEAPAQGDPLEKLTRIQERLGLYDDMPQAEQAAFEAWVAKVQPAYWRAEAWQTEAWAMWQSISAAIGSKERQPSVPAPWREAVKVMREALASAKRWHQGDKWRDNCTAEQRAAWEEHAANLDAAIALADSLEGGE